MPSITIDQLTDDERLALVGLLKLVVRADRELSAGEVQELNQVAREMGPELWKRTVAQASERFHTRKDVSQAAEAILGRPLNERVAGLANRLSRKS